MLNLDTFHSTAQYTSSALDNNELDSVIYHPGWTNLLLLKEEDIRHSSNGSTKYQLKFDFGSLKDCKNILVARTVAEFYKVPDVKDFQKSLNDFAAYISKSASAARVLGRIIRSNKIAADYVVIGNNLNFESLLKQLKSRIVNNVVKHKTKDKREKVLKGQELVKFDV